MDLKSLERICSGECRLEKGSLLVAGVSGGADSLTLVDSLTTLGFNIVIAHFDHHLRVDSKADADFVNAYAARKGLVFEAGSGDVAGFARDYSLSIEEAARQMRYTFLFDVARQHHAQAVAVGHTADDQVETVLMHILRGAGLSGLKGMPWRGILEIFDPVIPVVRPLLGVWRIETEDWCRKRDLDPRVDPTNRDTAYARNHLRQEIIPLLESYSPQTRRHIWQMAEHLQGDYRVLAQLAEEKLQACLVDSGSGYLGFDRSALSALDPVIQGWVIRRAVFQLVRELRDFDSAAVERSLEAIASTPARWQGDLPGGIRMRVEGNRLYLKTWSADLPGMDLPQLPKDYVAQLTGPGRVAVGNDWWITVEKIDNLDNVRMVVLGNNDPNHAWIDADQIATPLVVKCASAGQRFQPLGMIESSQKLSDFWVNVKLPHRARAGWPVIVSGDRIVWLPGFRIAHAFRLTEDSKSAFHLILELNAAC
jgi:tRNA(Ile)-lysidine synthase